MDVPTDVFRHSLAQLITSLHILHHHNILTEAGTLSIRNPTNPTTFIICNRSAISVSSPADLSELYVADATPVQRDLEGDAMPPSRHFTPEPYIHSCIYAKYTGVRSVVHSPAVDFVVYGLCNAKGSMSRAVFNKAGFVDDYNPTFNPTEFHSRLPAGHAQNLLIDHPLLGNALAEALVTSNREGGFNGNHTPEHAVGFIRGNGAVLWSSRLEEVVFKAISLQRNVHIQTAAMLQRTDSDLEITYLSPTESKDCHTATQDTVLSAWDAWASEVLRTPLYRNTLRELIQSSRIR